MIERIDDERCDCCQVCLQVCPCDVFRLDPDARRVRIVYRDDCQTCFTCELDCPQEAIHVGPLRAPRVRPW